MDRVMVLKAEIEEVRALLNIAAADIGSIQCNPRELMELSLRLDELILEYINEKSRQN
jgi:hypothetical protein